MSKSLLSNHNWGKLEDLPVINTSPIDNAFCLKMSQSKKNVICSYCYSIKTTIPNSPNNIRCRNAWKKNGNLLSREIIPYDKLPTTKTKNSYFKYVRISSHGELLNEIHFHNIINICRKNPYTRFSLWTKRIDIIKKLGHLKPENLTLIYSQPKINALHTRLPPHFDKVFSIYTSSFAKENHISINCTSDKCLQCLKCYKKNNQIFYINEILKGTPINWVKVMKVLLQRIDTIEENKEIIESIEKQTLITQYFAE